MPEARSLWLADVDDWWCCAPTPGSLGPAMFTEISLLNSTAHSWQHTQYSAAENTHKHTTLPESMNYVSLLKM